MKVIARFLVFVSAILGLAAAVSAQTTTAPTWQVQKYDVDAAFPQDSGRAIPIKAVVNLKNVSGKPATSLTLRISPNAEISTVRVNNSPLDFSKAEEKFGSATLQRISLRLPAIPADGLVTASIDYKINLKENTALNSLSPTSAQFLPLSYWYPTPNSWFFARGSDVAPVRVKATAAPGLTVLSSGIETAGAFEHKLYSQPFILAGNWEVNNYGKVAVYAPKGSTPEASKRGAELAGVLSDAVEYMTGILGKAPDVPLRVVASRRGSGYANSGVFVVDEGVFRRSKLDSLTVMNLSEGVAKLWLGNSVQVNGDGYGVVSEGLSRYIATQFIENKFGKDIADVERLRHRSAYAAVSKRDAPMSIVSPLDDYYYPVVANKGSMLWRILAKRVGSTEFTNLLKGNMQDGSVSLPELRTSFAAEKSLIDYMLDQVTDTNLLVGLPQAVAGETKVALRNIGSADVNVEVTATTDRNEKLSTSNAIKAGGFADVSFRTPAKIIRVEVDPEKVYPQTDYSDDVKPAEIAESDPLLAAKRLFDKQDFAGAEAVARKQLLNFPRFDDLRVILGRALLAQGKVADADKEFRTVLDEKLPSSRSLAWSNVGLADIAARASQAEGAAKFAEAAILADADYGASLLARSIRSKWPSAAVDSSVKAFFSDFDKAASANRKADIDALVMPGEVTRFSGGVAGSTEQWQTQVRSVDRIDANTVLVETTMNIKLLNKEPETGMAVYKLVRVGSGWKLASVEIFEVR
jgi:hypothetical protein